MQVYLVGGAVRDQLLGLPVKERDWVVVGATPAAMLALGYQQVGRDFPVFLHPKTREEYALARKERKTGAGYYGFECEFDPKVTLEDDLSRRDLTINAMAKDKQDHLIDPFGGQADLKAGCLRHVSPAFTEDPVRVLRVARFKAAFHHLGFQLADETASLIYRMVKQGVLAELVPERVWQEWEKSFCTRHPEQFMMLLRQTGALASLFPEIDALFGVPAKPRHHPEIDAGVHTLDVVARLIALQVNNPLTVFAALTHDVGKAATPRESWPSHADHDQRGGPILTHLCARLRVPQVYQRLASLVLRQHLNVHEGYHLDEAGVLTVLVEANVFRQHSHLDALLQVCEADATARFPDRPFRQRDFWKAAAEACLAIETTPWVQQGLSGLAIQKALKEARLKAIRLVKHRY